MSSLRLETMRLCWLEAFVAVAEAENISAAARKLGVSQPTVSRYIQRLRHWTGRKLIEVGRMTDPDDVGVNVGLTADGHEFFEIAKTVTDSLKSFRTETAQRKEVVTRIKTMLKKVRNDLEGAKPTNAAITLRPFIEQFEQIETIDPNAPLAALETIEVMIRNQFTLYEQKRAKELRGRRQRRASSINASTLRVP